MESESAGVGDFWVTSESKRYNKLESESEKHSKLESESVTLPSASSMRRVRVGIHDFGVELESEKYNKLESVRKI